MQSGLVLAGKYRLETLLGRGGMGSVWRATHLGLQAPVAIKLIDAAIVANAEALARFIREARAAAGLRSPHVVQILDHGVDEPTQTPFIAMELMEGETLGQRLERVSRLSPEDTARVITEVSRALGRAHETGIIHRDLKPDNVFLVRNEDAEIAKVLDFGIAKSHAALGIDSSTRTGAVMGTPYYMSPEQISGAKNIDHRSDIWALGVIAYECITGQRPFDADSIGGLTLKICVEPLKLPSSLGSVPAGLDAWFERAVARDSAQRFQSARELSEGLRRVCAGQAALMLTASGASTAERPPSVGAVSLMAYDATTAEPLPMKRFGGVAITAVVAVAVLAVGAAGVWMTRSHSAVSPTVTAMRALPPRANDGLPAPSVVPPAIEPVGTLPTPDARGDAPEPSSEPTASAPALALSAPHARPVEHAPPTAVVQNVPPPSHPRAHPADARGATSNGEPSQLRLLDERR